MAEIRCPMCGHNNPEGLLNCEKCDARLVPMGALGETDARPGEPEMDEQDDLASLLDDLINDGSTESFEEDSVADDSEILSWLDEEQPAADSDFLSSDVTDESIPSEEEEQTFNLLDEIEPPLDEKSINDWLDTSPHEEDVSNDDWLSAIQDDFGETQQSSEAEFLPDWLEENLEIESESDEEIPTELSEEPVNVEIQLPDWMGDSLSADLMSPEEGDTSFDEDAATVRISDLAEDEDAELPDWFTKELDVTKLTPADVVEEAESLAAEESEIPWLEELPESQEESEDVFDFLKEDVNEQASSTEESAQPEAVEETSGKGSVLGRFSSLFGRKKQKEAPEPALPEQPGAEEELIAEEPDVELPMEDLFAETNLPEEELAESVFELEEFGLPITDDDSLPEAELPADEELAFAEEETSGWDELFESEEFSAVAAEELDWLLSDEGQPEELGVEEAAVSDAEEELDFSDFDALPDWMSAEQEPSSAAEEPVSDMPEEPVEEEAIASGALWDEEPPVSEPPVEEPDVFSELFEGESPLDAEEAAAEEAPSTDELLSGLFDDFDQATAPSEETSAEEDTVKRDITGTLAEKGVPEWLEDFVGDEDRRQPEQEADLYPKIDASGLPKFMDDNMEFTDVSGGIFAAQNEEELPDEDDIAMGELPEWMIAPEESHGKTDEMLDNLETGEVLPEEELLESAVETAPDTGEIEDWLASMAEEPAFEVPDDETEGDLFEGGEEELATLLEDDEDGLFEENFLAADDESAAFLPMDESVLEQPAAAETAEDALPVELADFISAEEELPEWMDLISADAGEDIEELPADETPEEMPIYEEQGTTGGFLPDWLSDMESGDDEVEERMESRAAAEMDEFLTTDGTAALPDWLSDYSDEAEEPEMNNFTADSDELDAWLVEQGQELPKAAPADEEELEAEEFPLPAFLTEGEEMDTLIDDVSGTLDETEGIIPFEVEKELPDWVFDLEPEETDQPLPEMKGGGTAELPGWIVSDEEPEMEIEEVELPPIDEELFDFMAEDGSAESLSISSDFDSFADFEDEEFDLSAIEAEMSGDALFEEPSAAFSEDLEALESFDFSGEQEAFAENAPSEEEGGISSLDISELEGVEESYMTSMELEDQQWLSEYEDEDQETPALSGTTSPFNISLDDMAGAEQEGVAVAEELPDWVDKFESSEDDFDFWEEPLTAMTAISGAAQTTFDQEKPVIDAEHAHVQLMERILLSEKGTVSVAQSRRRSREITLRLVLTLLLIVAVLAGLFSLITPLPNFIKNPPVAVVQFENLVRYHRQTTNNQPVLVVFDYQPAYHGELATYAELPLKSLMQSNARIFTFSTVPEGPALSQKLLADVVLQNGLVYNTRDQAVHLGYLPGGSSAVRDFSTRLRSTVHGLDAGSSSTYVWDLPTTADVDHIDDFSMVIVITDDLDKARLWIEQATLYLPETTPLLMISSARISPLLKPYLLSEQVDGLVGSPVDAAAYGTLANEIGNYHYYWRAYQLGIYLMIFTVIAGAIFQILRQLQSALKRGK